MSEEVGQDEAEKPMTTAINLTPSPISGVVPPVEHRFKEGNKLSPSRPAAGATIKQWLNVFAADDLDEESLRRIAGDRKAPWPKRAAANRAIKTMESPDLSDFAGLLRGENQLEDLRAMGINTDVVKKFKQKTRKVSVGEGQTEEVIDREIELYDRSGTDFERVVNHTDGSPIQTVRADVHSTGVMDDKKALALELVDAMRKADDAGKSA